MLERNRKIRGVDTKKYAHYMHQVERGETSENTLIRKKLLLPGKGIALNRDDKIFHFKSKISGQKIPNQCTVPHCNNAPYRRGLCNTHRIYAKRMIRLGKATETNLIRRGILLPSTQNLPKKYLRNPKKRCLYPKCIRPQKNRGLCKNHHQLFLRKSSKLNLKNRKLLEKDLIKRKLILPKSIELNAFELGSKIKGQQ